MIALAPGTLALFFAQQPEPVLVETQDYIILGRAPNGRYPILDLSQIQNNLEGVSTHHAAILFNEGEYYITDLNSTSGTWVNDERLPAEMPRLLQNGDQIRIGQVYLYVCFVVEASAV
jgi:pSer/pThr/pTyr-binding forkhead associated (FHA) protein